MPYTINVSKANEQVLQKLNGLLRLSEPYLEKGLGLEEGSDDWLIAANQYLLAGALTNKTKIAKYVDVFKKFKDYAFKGSSAYYTKMANMYQGYYE